MAKPARKPIKIEPVEIRVKDPSYKPTKEELREDVSINASPDDILKAVCRDVKVVYE